MADRCRTDSGTLRATCQKAIKWYAIEKVLKPMAAAAYPNFYFRNRDGKEVVVSIVTIMDAYDEFKKKTHGAAKAA